MNSEIKSLIYFSRFERKQAKKKWRTREDSNLQPPESESVTLSIELRAQRTIILLHTPFKIKSHQKPNRFERYFIRI